jgi:hypothetical protein
MSADLAATGPAGAPEPAAPRAGQRRLGRWVRRALALVVALVAALVVSLFTIDLGGLPRLRAYAEAEASRYLERPMRIGRIEARLTPGDFILRDVVIEGREPGDRPFFQAERIFVHVPWWTIFRQQIVLEVTLTDWRMVIETWPGRGHNVPKLTPRTRRTGPSRYRVIVPFVRADGGEFIYDDHGTPWSVAARNLAFDLVRSAADGRYVGRASFAGGTVQIQQFLPMRADMTTRFYLDGPRVMLQHIDLTTDGSRSHVNGVVEFGRGIDHTYNFNSEVDFPRMKEIFFATESWRLSGEGRFAGVFRLPREGGRTLAGEFRSDRAAINQLVFPNLHGTLVWTPAEFAVTHAEADFLGGTTRFDYGLRPLGTPRGATATFTADYADLALDRMGSLVDLGGLTLEGRADGRLAVEWANGRFARTRTGRGHTVVEPPADVTLAPPDLPAAALAPKFEPEPFEPMRPAERLPVGADVHYTFDPEGWTFEDSSARTSHTHITFSGRMASPEATRFPFHVTSHDWQESDRLLAAIMTAVAGPTRAVEVGGRGTFEGVMTGAFASPRIEGRFDGDAIRAWDVTWGPAAGDIVIQNRYLTLANSRIGGGTDRLIQADGRFSLGFREDEAEEIEARVRLTGWPVADLRHAFGLDDWRMDGTIGEAALQLRGQYRDMFGDGTVRIDRGVAWGESFAQASGDVVLEGTGLRISRLEMRKGTGVVRGAARIGWSGTYAFTADGESIPVESLDSFRFEGAPFSGSLSFRAAGAGEFDRPSYQFRGQIPDLFVGDEGIGPVEAALVVKDDVLMIERLSAASSRLQVVGTGTIALNEQNTADLRLRFQQTSIDPYLKFFAPEVSPYTRIIVSGGMTLRGPLAESRRLTVDADIEEAILTLFDYELRNDGVIDLTLAKERFGLGRFRLRGVGTSLELRGGADLVGRQFDLSTEGAASLAILQLFFRDLTASGAATLNASLRGTFDEPRLTGEAQLTDARVRPLASPHSLQALNGRIVFDGRSISFDDLSGRVGSGRVDFGGLILLDGFRLSEYDVTATGRSMVLRFPEGFRSTVDMDLRLQGPMTAPSLTGTVSVLRTVFLGTPGAESTLAALATGGAIGPVEDLPITTDPSGLPVALDVQVYVPPTTLIDRPDGTAEIRGSADLHVGGTVQRPVVSGAVEILSGEVLFNGNRYFLNSGSIEFADATTLDPFFDISATTRPRAGGQTYRVDLSATGRLDALNISITSDPDLPQIDILTLLLGGTPNLDTAELRGLRSQQEAQAQLFQTLAAQIIASPLSSRVGSVVRRTLPFVDTVQITPFLASDDALRQLNPSARVTLGTRISNRVYLTYSRTLSTQDEILLIEYDQSDRISWVLSRNEDRTFALDVRVRFVF